ncbi:MAG: Gfo/Idh/MocA family oxidoreductase, partial [Verrucomicrobiota bacterium]
PSRGFHEVLCPIGLHSHFPQWRRYREYAGGGLSDIGAHHFDIAQWALGRDDTGPVSIVPPKDSAATSGLTFRYADGLEMVHGAYEGRNGCHFIGTKGYLFVDRKEILSTPGEVLETPLTGSDWRLDEISENHQRNWVDCIHSGEKPVADVEIGHRTNTICALGNIGYWLNRDLEWDPESERFQNDDEANELVTPEDREPWNGIVSAT